MLQVLHPEEFRLIDHAEYTMLAADKGYQKANDWGGGRCPVCKRPMYSRGGHKKDDGHFYHNDKEFCPTKEPAARPYISKPPTKIDVEAEERNRNFVRENIEQIYGVLNQDLVPFLDFKEFISILKRAKELRVYGYANLEPGLLPYVYATLINFLPSKSRDKKRKLKFCFFFDAAIQEFDDLWIDRGEHSVFLRVSYNGQETKKVNMFNLNDTYLNKEYFKMSDKQKKWAMRNI
ncbi:hypothetical protein FIU82_07430 [Pseudoalteromonas sp. THAF3]|uniref:hypothetical protein n=1 Tax=Pseudoalteromonas sp. THAF3 TaxID=2587843 RepID=UPI0012698237|nr:hypothetical protein [Pseudoalteromonas sp. THAF3]QFU04843.1 hypothetical protein FIU82_07430 [Pseudoalteromonas sp. THAF3]